MCSLENGNSFIAVTTYGPDIEVYTGLCALPECAIIELSSTKEKTNSLECSCCTICGSDT